MPVVAIVVGVLAFGVGILGGAGAILLSRRRHAAEATIPPPHRLTDGPRRRANQPLASLVVEALDHGVVVIDRDDRAILVNPAARAMGVLDIDRLAFPELAGLAFTARDRAVITTSLVDLPIGRLGREPIALSVTAVPLASGDEGERPDSVALLLADVSEQRRLEAVRRDFVANVSHELKTPVGALT
ncbi:MAG: phoR, partial [Pseudonocardiales bacterium]|nr:phoR [Pseudonocardiales bacterium]